MNDNKQPWLRDKRRLKLAGLAAALGVLPLGAFAAYRQLQEAGRQRDRSLEKAFDYDASALRSVDPGMISHRQIRRIDVGLAARAIAVDPASGHMLAAAENVIRRLDATGRLISDISIAGTPYALALDSDGTIFVGFKDRVELYSAHGKRVSAWPSLGGGSYITCIAVAGEDVYVADAGRRVILRYDRQGKLLKELARRDEARGIEGLLVPSAHLDVAVAGDGLVWIANPGRHRLEAYARDGTLHRYWGVAGAAIDAFHGCCNPADFLLLADGSFITAEKGVARIKRYDGDGFLESVITSPTEFQDSPRGLDLAADASGNVLVLERGTQVVRVYAREDGGAP